MTSSFRIFFGSAVLAASTLALSAAVPVQAQTGDKSVCLNVTEIKSTQATSRRTIEYTMRDGKVWRNTLAADCPTLLGFGSGAFSQVVHNDIICANQQEITTETGNVCRLGEFARVR